MCALGQAPAEKGDGCGERGARIHDLVACRRLMDAASFAQCK